MGIDNVQDITPREQYTASASQTVFTVPFPFQQNSDVVVYVGTTLQITGSDYDLTGAGDDNGGTCTFTAGLTAGDIVTFYRRSEYARGNDYTAGGGFSAASVNADFDNVLLRQQELETLNQRTLRVPMTDTTGNNDMELPAASDRAGKYLIFDPDGKPGTSTGTGGGDSSLRTDLASTDPTEGAAIVGIEDSAGHFDSTTVEGALAEIGQDAAILQDVTDLTLSGRSSLSRGIVSFFYDDTNAEVYTDALAIHEANGVPASVAVSTGDFLIGSGKMTLAQLRELVDDYGWEISSHGVSHASFTTAALTEDAANRELADSYRILRQLGFDPRLWVTPFSGMDAEFIPYLKRYYDGGYTVYTDTATATAADPNMAAPIDPYGMTRIEIGSATVADVKAMIDYAAANNTWLVLYDHEPGTDISIADLTEILEYIAAADVDALLPYEALQKCCTTQVKGEGPIRLARELGELQGRGSDNLLPFADFNGAAGPVTASASPPAYWTVALGSVTGTVTRTISETFGGNRLIIETDGTNTGADEEIQLTRSIDIPRAYRNEILTFGVSGYISAGDGLELKVRAITKNGGVTVDDVSTTYPMAIDEIDYPITVPVLGVVDQLQLVISVVNTTIGNAATAVLRCPRLGVGTRLPQWGQLLTPVKEVAMVRMAATQTIAASTTTTVLFDTADDDALSSYTTADGFLRAHFEGLYRVSAFVNFSAMADGKEVWARVTYGSTIRSVIVRAAGTGDAGVFISCLVRVTDVGTPIQVQAFHDDTVDRDVDSKSWAHFEYVGK